MSEINFYLSTLIELPSASKAKIVLPLTLLFFFSSPRDFPFSHHHIAPLLNTLNLVFALVRLVLISKNVLKCLAFNSFSPSLPVLRAGAKDEGKIMGEINYTVHSSSTINSGIKKTFNIGKTSLMYHGLNFNLLGVRTRGADIRSERSRRRMTLSPPTLGSL